MTLPSFESMGSEKDLRKNFNGFSQNIFNDRQKFLIHENNRKIGLPVTNMALLVGEIFHEVVKNETNRSIKLCVGKLPACEVEAAVARQVLLHLIKRAVKATTEIDQAVITVSANIFRGKTIFIVSDNGESLDTKYSDAWLDIFPTTKERLEFDNAELRACLRFITINGGQIWVGDLHHEGTTIFFTLNSTLKN